MAIFGPKRWVNPFRKMSNFRLFKLFVFIAQKGFFLVLEYSKRHFPGLYCLKKNVGKMAIFGPKPSANRSEKCQFFDFLNFRFYSLERCFLVLQYRKTHFPGLYCLKKKVGIMAIFRTKPWVNPFQKMSILRLFELCVFIVQKGVFCFQNIVKDIFLAYSA